MIACTLLHRAIFITISVVCVIIILIAETELPKILNLMVKKSQRNLTATFKVGFYLI